MRGAVTVNRDNERILSAQRTIAEREHHHTLQGLWYRVTTWQREQFPGGTIEGAAAHLHKEAAEVRSAVELREPPHRLGEECADVFFMIARVCDLAGIGPHEFAGYVAEKLRTNKARSWPTEPNAEGVYAHTKEAA